MLLATKRFIKIILEFLNLKKYFEFSFKIVIWMQLHYIVELEDIKS